ncbi:tyrosine-type recombinase/integrase [Pseudogemmobacter bohemicus]|uniref:tyrosine-type recombinase/integrase n=1 Tax=Pseudogemmobacter bohemicus TaxID=2250708 RepID=UPI000DD49AE2|nr:hypothetical protein [Pseudogemmobacter bohemicus]
MARRPEDPPVIAPKDGLRQRRRSDGEWRIWWEPTKRQREIGAKPVEFQARQPGHAQREATRLANEWSARAEGKPVTARRDGRSTSALIEDYRRSRHYTQLRETTRRSYDTDLRAIEDKWGPQPVSLFDPVMMDQWYDALLTAKSVTRARAILTMMRTLLKHAERRGWRTKGSNPARDLDMQRPEGRSRVGTWAELDALLDACRQLARGSDAAGRITWRGMRLAILLTTLAGQRQTDVREAKPDGFGSAMMQLAGMPAPRRIWVWALIRSKRQNEGQIGLHPMIVPALRLQLRLAADGPGTLIWDQATGNPLSKRLMWDRWQKIRDLAAETVPSVTTIQWRDLRRTFGNLARAGGADKSDVADVLGNTADTDATLAKIYMEPQVATTWRAATAIARPAPVEQETPKRRKA